MRASIISFTLAEGTSRSDEVKISKLIGIFTDYHYWAATTQHGTEVVETFT
jgi:hypothetical protein